MVLKLYYWAVAARAEASRLILTVGNVPYEEVTVSKDAWPELKPKTPLGQIPVLELDDGRQIAQSGAIERYTAKLAGLYPADAYDAAIAEQTAFLLADIQELVTPTSKLPDVESKTKAQQELLAGPLTQKLQLLAKPLAKQTFLVGDSLTFVDLVVFAYLGRLKSGVFEGIPKSLLDNYPDLKAWYSRVANVDAIKKRYQNAAPDRQTYQSA